MTRNTIAHTDAHNTQFWAHCAPPVDAQWFHIALVAQDCLVCVIHVIHACALVVGVLSCLSSSLCPSFSTSSSLFLFPALPDVHLSVQREVHVKPPVLLQLGERGHIRLRHTPHRLWAQAGLEPHERWRARPRYHQRYLLPERPGRHGFLPQRSRRRRQPACGISLQLWSIEQGNLLRWEAIMINFPVTLETWKVLRVSFPLVTQPEMICQTGGSVQARIAEERENAHAQIRTMLDEQRRTIIAECNEKVLHHELLAAHAEQDRKILQEELLRKQQEFREVHQQDLMKTSRIAKIPEFCLWWVHSEEVHRRSENYYGIIWKTSRTTEWSKFSWMIPRILWMLSRFCSGNPHVTSQPGLFPKHPLFEGIVEAFIRIAATHRWAAKYQGYIRYIRKRFCTSTSFFVSSVSSGIKFHLEEKLSKNQFTCLLQRKVEDQSETQIWDASPDRQPKIQSSSVEETLQRIMGQTNNDCRFRIFILTNSLHQLRLLAGR